MFITIIRHGFEDIIFCEVGFSQFFQLWEDFLGILDVVVFCWAECKFFFFGVVEEYIKSLLIEYFFYSFLEIFSFFFLFGFYFIFFSPSLSSFFSSSISGKIISLFNIYLHIFSLATSGLLHSFCSLYFFLKSARVGAVSAVVEFVVEDSGAGEDAGVVAVDSILFFVL